MSFVTLSKDQFENILPNDFKIVDNSKSKEIIYDLNSINSDINIRIYSTIDIRTNQTRDIGKDAIRIVFWDNVNDKPIGKGKKILRTEGATTIQDRIKNRIDEFMIDAKNQKITDYKYIQAVLDHDAVNWMDFAQSLSDQLHDRGSLTDSQIAYIIGDKNPKGKPTFEARVKMKDPDFGGKENGKQEETKSSETRKKEDNTEEEKQTEKKRDESLLESCHDNPCNEAKGIRESTRVSGQNNGTGNREEQIQGLIPTSSYNDYQYSFDNFNPVQSEVFKHIDEDKNMIIGANTSAGKTICAELLMDHVLKNNERIIYLSPLKALTQEKYDDWQKRFADEDITILTGDYVLSKEKKEQLLNSKIIVMTSEMLDSRTRKMEQEKNYWMKQVGLIICDESHIITTSRGHAVEAGIMRFTRLNPKARVLFLSATMPNVNELGEWLTILNKKETTVIYNTWRPVELQYHFHEYTITVNRYGREDYWQSQERKRSEAVKIAMSKPNEAFLIFVHDKNTGRDIVRRLKDLGENAVFHNADADLSDRIELEDNFRDRKQRILVSTSTLAWGSVREDTQIMMSGGYEKLALELNRGDSVLSYNEETGLLEQDFILNIEEYTSRKELEIELEDGNTIFVDRKHPFYIRKDNGEIEVKEAQYLKEDDDVILLNNFI